jgi:alkylation response protein AidB-like acyl-CoA dehydrogenase
MQDDILHIAADLAHKFAGRAAHYDQVGTFPLENYDDLRASGYPLLPVPQEYGGWGATLLDAVKAQELLGQADGSTALAVTMHVQVVGAEAAARSWNKVAYEHLCREIVTRRALVNACGTEPELGNPVRGGLPRTIARRNGGNWLVNGRKTFATMSPVLDYYVVPATIPEADHEIGTFLVPRQPNVIIEPTWDTMGMRSTGSHDLILTDAHVDNDLLIGQSAPQKVNNRLNPNAWFILTVSAVYIGIAAAAQRTALEYARQRVPAALGKPIATLESIQRKLGESELALQVARTLLYSAAEDWDRYPEKREGMSERLAIAKIVTTNHAIQIVDAATRVVGGTSMNNSSPLSRYYRDVRAGLYHPPNDDSTLPILGQSALQRLNPQ